MLVKTFTKQTFSVTIFVLLMLNYDQYLLKHIIFIIICIHQVLSLTLVPRVQVLSRVPNPSSGFSLILIVFLQIL